MQHHVFIILVLTDFNSSLKCHLQDNIYNTVIYCNNWGLKFHKKRNKTALPLPTTWIDLPKTSEMSLPNFRLLVCWWGIGSVRLALLHPSGCITFPGIMSILPGAVCVSNLGRKECLRYWVSLCVSVCVSASQVYARLKSGCQCLWLICRFAGCVCTCVYISVACVRPRVCVSVSDRCVGSGLQSCWHCGLALLSLVCRPCRHHSRSAGTAPNRVCLSCDGACTPGPPSALAYRYETRSVWHSTDPRSSLQISGKYPPLGLKIEGRDTCHMKQTSLKTTSVVLWTY